MKGLLKQTGMLMLTCGVLLLLMGCSPIADSSKTEKTTPLKNGSSSKTIEVTYLSKDNLTLSKKMKMKADSMNKELFSFLVEQQTKRERGTTVLAKVDEKASKASKTSKASKNSETILSSNKKKTYFLIKKNNLYYFQKKSQLDDMKILSKEELERIRDLGVLNK